MLNKELKVALGVGIAMIVICLVIVMVQSNNKQEDINLKVYKLTAVEGQEDKHVYRQCSVSTEDLLKINKEYKRSKALRDMNQVQGKSINGDYKIIVNEDEYVAFDNAEDKMIYVGKENRLYNFSSDIYEIAIKACE